MVKYGIDDLISFQHWQRHFVAITRALGILPFGVECCFIFEFIAIIIIIISEWTLLIIIHSKSLSSGEKQVGGINNFTLRIHRLIISIIVIVNNAIINIISINNTIDNISTSIVTKIITSLSSISLLVALATTMKTRPSWIMIHNDHPGVAVPQH